MYIQNEVADTLIAFSGNTKYFYSIYFTFEVASTSHDASLGECKYM
jgi:hypothetical protein